MLFWFTRKESFGTGKKTKKFVSPSNTFKFKKYFLVIYQGFSKCARWGRFGWKNSQDSRSVYFSCYAVLECTLIKFRKVSLLYINNPKNFGLTIRWWMLSISTYQLHFFRVIENYYSKKFTLTSVRYKIIPDQTRVLTQCWGCRLDLVKRVLR